MRTLVVLVAVLALAACKPAGDSKEDKERDQRVAAQTPEDDARRDALVEKLIGARVFKRVDYDDNGVTLFVGREWRTLTLTEKSEFINVVMTASVRKHGKGADLVRVVDGLTGKRLGAASSAGVDLD